ncbi:MAG: tetratricopeptide repeat protein [Actinomycetaceae bacterium]|nr:tetratricopeptide repeat protein [Actinomycetaceae bacterium]
MANEQGMPADTRGAVSLGQPGAQPAGQAGAAAASGYGAGAPTGANGAYPAAEAAAQPGQLTGPIIRDIDESDLEEIVEISNQLPVVIDLWADWCQPCKQLSPILDEIVKELDGRVVLAKVDVEANPQLAQMFQAQSIPTVVAIIGGRPVPLFQGAQPKEQVVAVFNELLKIAANAGLTGRMIDSPQDAAPKVNPLHEAALAAEDAGDLEGAIAQWHKVLANSPKDTVAKEAIARLKLAQRVKDGDDSPMSRADQAFVDGDADSAFGMLLDIIQSSKGSDDEAFEAARTRLLEMFTVLGNADPRVKNARGRLSSLLF